LFSSIVVVCINLTSYRVKQCSCVLDAEIENAETAGELTQPGQQTEQLQTSTTSAVATTQHDVRSRQTAGPSDTQLHVHVSAVADQPGMIGD